MRVLGSKTTGISQPGPPLQAMHTGKMAADAQLCRVGDFNLPPVPTYDRTKLTSAGRDRKWD